jgi:succinate dehydrogenase/fumarate reductase flavoprotein subunit
LALAQSVGGSIDTDVAATGAWCPVSSVRWPDGETGVFPHIIDRGKPGVIAVRTDGKRFVNEADGYHDYVNALLAATPDGEAARSWMICDHRFIRRWGLGIVKPAPFPMQHWIKSGYLHRARTLDALAETCGISAQLVATVAAYNAHARRGHDADFGRGQSQYNRNQGDPDNTPNPNLAPIDHEPFYAVEVLPGSFGSFAGIKTNANAQVLHKDGSAISGLFAVGADMASVMGGHYPAGGINLGPAIAFGYLAAQHINKSI